jgi:hypothetical protein
MMTQRTTRSSERALFCLGILWLLGKLATLTACPIPVYQYALEHWPAENYVLEVFLPATPSADEAAAWQRLQRVVAAPRRSINLALRRQATAPEGATGSGGWLQLQYPGGRRQHTMLWQGALSSDHVDRILDSPARQRLGQALANRSSVVWVLLLSGNNDRDSSARRLIKENLAHLEASIIIPQQAEWGGQTIALDHKVSFHMLTIQRDDPLEDVFVAMLLASEADLRDDFQDQPLLFPVFGRGLLLYALAAGGINRWTLTKAIDFLTGACSCQVKAANPGIDLLLAVDWDTLVTPTTPATAGGTASPAAFMRAMQAQEEKDHQDSINLNTLKP